MPSQEDVLDCLVIGAGPAGLTAATYLARYHRCIAVIDAGASRARWIPTSHNCPGFPFGVGGRELLGKMREQAEGYGAVITPGRVTSLRRDADDGFVAEDEDRQQWRARHVVLATGIVDRLPEMDDIEGAIDAGAIRLCAVCDGYEASDECIAVHAPVDDAVQHALFLRTFSRAVSVLPTAPGEPSAECARLAREAGVQVLPVPQRIEHLAGEGCRITLADGGVHRFDTVYPVLGGDAQSALARELGAEVDDDHELVVDARQQTSIDGLYAIGDIVSALNQISVAVGQAAIAATAIHNRLPRNFRGDTDSQPACAQSLPSPQA
ncbi:MAG: NAD(P)/FAD-dependent oxidoreductase [Pseudomonadota bacterium]|nr:NAD(P)/FAD-dependent oxidoreductase [Pseudomonadota bacterium]